MPTTTVSAPAAFLGECGADWLREARSWCRFGVTERRERLLFEQTDFTAELWWVLGRTALHDAVDRLDGAHVDGDGVVCVEAGRSSRHSLIAALDTLRDFPDVHVVAEGGPETHGWWNGRRLLVVTRSGPVWRAELWKGLLTGIAVFARGMPLRPADQRWTAPMPEEAFAHAETGSPGALLR
ncbi:hypothetical protein [Micromonospora sp. NPDC048063]|uniref:hypothetical protein n=1 Tax=Micromonospora sp. NPDC048063 TaxID=3364256 RepID=UPI00371F4BA4